MDKLVVEEDDVVRSKLWIPWEDLVRERGDEEAIPR